MLMEKVAIERETCFLVVDWWCFEPVDV